MKTTTKIDWLKCHHGNLKKGGCGECDKERNQAFNLKKLLIGEIAKDTRTPIKRKCPNEGSPCFCTGVCNEIIGYVQV